MNSREDQAALAREKTGQSRPDEVVELYEAGIHHMRSGRHIEAQLCCQRALALDGNHADTLHLMGLLCIHARQFDHAVEWLSRAIRREPKPLYLTTLGTALLQQGRGVESIKVFEKAIELQPGDASLWRNLGLALTELRRNDEAILSFQHALKLDPGLWDAANNAAILLHQAARFEDALVYLNLCDELKPNNIQTLQLRAASTHGLKRFEEALEFCRQAHELEPENPDVCNHFGIVLRSLGKDGEALRCFDEALARRPNFADALHNKAAALTKLHRFHEVFDIYERLIAADPNDALASLGKAHLHLLMGNFQAGWEGREVRWKVARNYPRFAQPMWLGNESISGKTILVVADEGLGDTIQFVRYLPMLAEQGARIILAVQDSLHSLLSNFPKISNCLPMSTAANFSNFDFHCPIMSLPLAFGTSLNTIPAYESYLPSPREDHVRAWQRRLGAHDGLRVGLVWSGNPRHLDDHNRSVQLRLMSRLLDVDAIFISLQKEPKAEDRGLLQELPRIMDLTSHLTDFAETAALISCLDLVITVDTSVAHLSGALGCRTWILLPHTPDYRWLLEREDSPWYPTVRLFRQDERRDYTHVIERVCAELKALIVASALRVNRSHPQ